MQQESSFEYRDNDELQAKVNRLKYILKFVICRENYSYKQKLPGYIVKIISHIINKNTLLNIKVA